MRDGRFLSGCLVDSDSGSQQRSKQRRRRALGAALAVEALAMAGLAILPLMTPSGAPPQYVWLPRIPFHGTPAERPAAPHLRETSAQARTFVPTNPNLLPMHSSHPAAITDVSPPSIPGSTQSISTGPLGILHGTGDEPVIPAPPQPHPPRPGIIRRSEGVQGGLLVNRVEPQYPSVARTARISGTVELRAIIGRDGRVRSVEALSGSPLLAAAAEIAVRQWRYRPTLLDGEAVEVETLITVRFVLDE